MFSQKLSQDNFPKKSHILAVDDSPDSLFLIQAILEDENYNLTLAEDGQTALEKIEQSPPDLVLLDVMLPRMNGYEVLQHIRNNPDLPFMPILLMTAHEEIDVAREATARANGFLRKPFSIEDFLRQIQALLAMKAEIKSNKTQVQSEVSETDSYYQYFNN
ncbi:response regulator [Almyronema epifaneia]|uniref:Response regulator n=1 Tax=Almyronema epifaneia S1 TaxID=2991925 RepID=A0ABW6IAS4_9CYAN